VALRREGWELGWELGNRVGEGRGSGMLRVMGGDWEG